MRGIFLLRMRINRFFYRYIFPDVKGVRNLLSLDIDNKVIVAYAVFVMAVRVMYCRNKDILLKWV